MRAYYRWQSTVAGAKASRALAFFAGTILLVVSNWAVAETVVRVGAYPNITHSQAMVGKANGWFAKSLGGNVKIEWTTFNAGPAAIEALFAGAIDMTYIGSNPAITGYVRSNGEALRIIAGATSGGAALVVRNDSGIQKPQDFHGKKVATPQLGNTQDVALRAWLKEHGLRTVDRGGDVEVMPMANPDQLTLFQKKSLDAAWAPEPWASRLIREGDGRLFLDERSLWPQGQFITCHLIVATKFLHDNPVLIRNWIRAHVELTDWINGHVPEAERIVNEQIRKETGKALSPAVLHEAFERLQVTYDPLPSSLIIAARAAFDAGFMGKQMPDLRGMYDLTILNEVLAEKGKKPIS
jgi:NitT/TauT family transport system substrate-binding protein